MFKHMMPNIISPAIVGTTMSVGGTITQAAGLSFIGLGIQPPTPEWGAMLSDGRNYILTNPHFLIFPGLMIGIVVLCINLFGDGLRDAMDPKLKK
jgi:ABC-type dipeptide/oligopeptide/nickel transport system permease subunit